MRWIRYQADGKTYYGILEGSEVVEVSGSPFTRYRRTGKRRPFSSVKLLVPFEPKTFYAAGVNYIAHITEMAERQGREPNIPPKADVGYRANNALIAHGEAIVKPKDSTERFQYEGELVVVIGKQAKHLTEENAFSCVLGYTIGNDVSERTWQAGDRTLWRAKNTDTFKPMGPWIETDVDLDKMMTIVRLNGRQVTMFPTNNMLYGIAHYISEMTRYLTLYPGDMIWMGTDGAPENMKPGDVCEVEITGIGVLRNPIVAEE
ncbi:MAG: fumarylacetoacetate hydrolase family protein [Chloroflexi bacterium]|nr:fumarylacetoacetate hydrolase family protein [Chloroflexota bacterium]